MCFKSSKCRVACIFVFVFCTCICICACILYLFTFFVYVFVFVFVFEFECLPEPKWVCGCVPSDLSIYASINCTHVPFSSCMHASNNKISWYLRCSKQPKIVALHTGKLVCVKICKFLRDNDRLFLFYLLFPTNTLFSSLYSSSCMYFDLQ